MSKTTTITEPSVAGIVLAGGRSSRMGHNKALLTYNGLPLYAHMKNIIHASGINQVYVSGTVPDHPCISDAMPYQGPARTIIHLMQYLAGQHIGLLIVPVDMPLLEPGMLQNLVNRDSSRIFRDHPFPLYIKIQQQPVPQDITSMHQLIGAINATEVAYPAEKEIIFRNINTSQEWATLQDEGYHSCEW